MDAMQILVVLPCFGALCFIFGMAWAGLESDVKKEAADNERLLQKKR